MGAVGIGDDRFKLSGLTANVCSNIGQANGTTCSSVPEPGSFGLAGLAVLGVFASRRKVAAALKSA